MWPLWKLLKEQLISFVKNHWKTLLTILAALFTAKIVYDVIKQAVAGKVDKKIDFLTPEPNASYVLVSDPGNKETTIKVSLPDGIKAKDVEAVGFSENKQIIMEAKHEAVDRKSTPFGNSNSDMHI